MSAPEQQIVPIQRPVTTADDAEALRDVFASGWLTTGPTVTRFEERVSELLGIPAISTSNATASMFLTLLYWGIGPGDEVIVPAYTFVASAHAVVQTGATPVFCDVDLKTRSLDAARAATLVTERTKAILPVHLFGNPAPLAGVLELAAKHGLKVLEDAAQAFGAQLDGRWCGTIGDAGAFSFHARKIVTTGEGGAIGSRDAELLARIKRVRNNGVDRNPYDREKAQDGSLPDVDCLGFNSRLPDINAALGLRQLDRLDEFITINNAGAERYREAFADLDGLETPSSVDGARPAWQAFNVRLLEDAPITPRELIDGLSARGIRSLQASHFVPELTFYRDVSGYADGAYPNAQLLARRNIGIPLFPSMTADDQQRVIDAIRELWGARPLAASASLSAADAD